MTPAQHFITKQIEAILAADDDYCGVPANCKREYCAGVERVLVILDDFLMNGDLYIRQNGFM